jgi:DNA polymerase-3 subunit gamma/tau
VIPLVVRAAAGSARDGLSILDQVLASAGPDGVTREGAAALLGVTPDALLDGMIDSFAAQDGAAVFALLDQVMEGGHDPRRFATDVLERLRDLIVLDAVPDAGSTGLLDCPSDQLERMGRQATAMGRAGLSRAADLFHAGLVEMRGKTAPRLLLELVCARVLLPAASSDDGALLARLERLERRLEISGAPAPAAAAPAPRAGVPAPAAPPVPAAPAAPPVPAAPAPAVAAPAPAAVPVPAAAPAPPAPAAASAPAGVDAAALRASWDAVLGAVKSRKRTAHAQLADATVAQVSGRTLVLAFQHAPILRQFQAGTGPDVLREALRETLGADLDLECVPASAQGAGAATARPAGAAAPSSGPAVRPPAVEESGFAPGDEALPDDDPDGPPPQAAPRGEDAALRLVVDQLGGQVVSTTGED